MTKEAAKNYTEAQEARLQEAADEAGGKIDNALAMSLATELGKDVRSIRAKAVRMELYQAKAKTSKTGGKIESKEEIAAEIGALAGRNMESLAKASKVDLQALRDLLREVA